MYDKNCMDNEHFPLNTPFKPSPAFITWYNAVFMLIIVCIFIFLYGPITVFAGLLPIANLVILLLFAIAIILFFSWVKLYYASMWYELHQDEMRWKRGVWFRGTGIVPYNRITNIDIRQGPVMRWLGISTLSIQTAGYSGTAQPEISIQAIVHADELRELIRTKVRSCSALGDGTGTGRPVTPGQGASTDEQILGELKAIRQLLEKNS
ncbi:MAG TPA: PH domain-containing protein [Methanoregulaceae archaeon]|nr:PH domain-containing protein [Methanoregulaceae archaeon]